MHCSTTRAPRQQHGTGGPDPCLAPCAAEAHPHSAGKAWRAAGLELGLASHIGGASGEDRGNVECPPMRMTAWCPPVLGARADPTPHPSPAGPFVWLPQLRPFALSARPGPIDQLVNKKVPLIYVVPFQSPHATARGEGTSIAAVSPP